MPGAPPPADPPDPQALLRSRGYVQILILAAITGLPISAAAYGFLALVEHLQDWVFTDLPETLGYDAAPTWWPLPLLALSGVLTALAIRRLPGTGGHPPADGFKAAGALPPIELPGVLLAAFATLAFGAVLGPEAPLIAMGSGLGVLAVRLAARDAKPTVANVIAATGSFAAISSLLGSPLLGAFLLLEASGLGGAMLGLVLLPGLLAAGLGALIFLGLDSLSGLGALSLTIPNLPPFDHLTGAIFGWAIAFGLVAPFLGRGITLLAVAIRSRVEGRSVWLVAVLGLVIAGLAIGFGEATDKPVSNVLFSGQDAIGPLVGDAAGWSVGALLLLVAVQGARLLRLAQLVPRRPGVPVDVHRRGGRDRRLAPSRAADDPGGGDGHRRDVRRDAHAAVHRHAPCHPAAGRRRCAGDAGRDRRGRDRLRRHGAADAAPRAGRARATALRGRRRCRRVRAALRRVFRDASLRLPGASASATCMAE